MTTPYPWNDSQREFKGWKTIGRLARKVSVLPFIVAGFASPLSLFGRVWTFIGFERSNDAWYKRGLILMAFGATSTTILTLINPHIIWYAIPDIFTALTANEGVIPAVVRWLLVGCFPGAFFVGLSSLGPSFFFEYASEKYLRPVKNYGFLYRRRYRKNTEALAAGTDPRKDEIAFGLHLKDTLPWRSLRYGMLVGRTLLRDFGHGIIMGGTGSGKSVQALNICDQFSERGGAVVYIDFKGSRSVGRSLRDTAERSGVPFYSFSLRGEIGMPSVHYDPLSWPGLPTDKASVIMKALEFADGGGATFYKNAAEAWLPVQIEAMDAVGLREGEGSFDFLHETSTPAGLRERIGHYAKSDNPKERAMYQRWAKALVGADAKTLEGLRGNLQKVINSGGQYLRPSTEPDAINLDIRQAVAECAIIHFSLTTTLDEMSVTTIGALLIQDMIALVGQRVDNPALTRTEVLLVPDETSVLGERASLLENIFRQAREARVWVWPVTQSLAAWPETTRAEVMSNAQTKIIYNVADKISQEELVGGLSQIPHLLFQQGQEAETRLGGRREVTVGGRGYAKVELAEQLRPGDLNSQNRQAWVWFTGGEDPTVTIRPVRRRRVKKEEIVQDIVRIDTIARTGVLNSIRSAGPDDQNAVSAARELSYAAMTEPYDFDEDERDYLAEMADDGFGPIEPALALSAASPRPVPAASPRPAALRLPAAVAPTDDVDLDWEDDAHSAGAAPLSQSFARIKDGGAAAAVVAPDAARYSPPAITMPDLVSKVGDGQVAATPAAVDPSFVFEFPAIEGDESEDPFEFAFPELPASSDDESK